MHRHLINWNKAQNNYVDEGIIAADFKIRVTVHHVVCLEFNMFSVGIQFCFALRENTKLVNTNREFPRFVILMSESLGVTPHFRESTTKNLSMPVLRAHGSRSIAPCDAPARRLTQARVPVSGVACG